MVCCRERCSSHLALWPACKAQSCARRFARALVARLASTTRLPAALCCLAQMSVSWMPTCACMERPTRGSAMPASYRFKLPHIFRPQCMQAHSASKSRSRCDSKWRVPPGASILPSLARSSQKMLCTHIRVHVCATVCRMVCSGRSGQGECMQLHRM